MPMPIAHGFLGASIVAAIIPKSFEARYYLPILTGALLANLADFDFIFVLLAHNKEWHRGFTHSIIFSIFVGLLFYFYFGLRLWREALAYSLAYASHFILDFTSTKIGGGLELFFPLSHQRYGLRWFGLSEYPSKMSVSEIIISLMIEFLIFALLFFLIVFVRNKSKTSLKN